MKEENYRRWDIIAKFIAPVLTVAGILAGIWQFSAEQSAQLQRQRDQLVENNKLDFKRRIWERQSEVYSRISRITGRIASASYKNDKKKFAADINEFDSIYWGELIYVKDTVVEEAMVNFHTEARNFLQGATDEDRLKLRAAAVGEACRKSSQETWFNIIT